MKIFKKSADFFEIFDQMGRNLSQTAALMVSFFKDFSNIPEKANEIKGLERENDLLTHDIIRRLNQTFVTPIDREDVHMLASRMDDILDLMWSAVERSQIFRLQESTSEAVALSQTLVEIIDLICRALHHLKKKEYSYIYDLCIQIHGLENQNDRIFRETIGRLFDEIKDPILIIKWKDVYQNLENATDKCEDVANTLESIVLKYA